MKPIAVSGITALTISLNTSVANLVRRIRNFLNAWLMVSTTTVTTVQIATTAKGAGTEMNTELINDQIEDMIDEITLLTKKQYVADQTQDQGYAQHLSRMICERLDKIQQLQDAQLEYFASVALDVN
jgi:hypothetical protein